MTHCRTPIVAAVLTAACLAAFAPARLSQGAAVTIDPKIAAQVEAQLRSELKLFYPRAVDTTNGGFYPNFSEDWSSQPQTTKQLVFQSRMTWTAAEVALRRPDLADEYRGYAKHGLEFLRDKMWDAQDGGFFWSLDGDARAAASLGDEKHAYGISFAIYAAANAYKLSHDPAALDLAQRGFLWFDQHAHDNEHGGYFEALSRAGQPLLAPPLGSAATAGDRIGTPFGYKSMNTHIHLLESITTLYRVWPDPRVKTRLAEMLGIVRDRIAVRPGCLNMYFTPDWRPVPAADSFGHDVESTYLLIEADEALNGSASRQTLAVARSLTDHALEVAWDARAGGFFNEGTFSKASDRSKVWWVEAEGLNSLLLMHGRFGSQTPRYAEAFDRQWAFIRDTQIDSKSGGWFDEIRPNGSPKPGRPKSQDWKACYHSGRAMLNVSDALREMSGSKEQ